MPIADDIELSVAADADLRSIGGMTEQFLFGELYRLPTLSEDECRPLIWQPEGESLRRVEIGDYSVTVTIENAPAGRRVAVVERVVLTADLDRWLDEQVKRAER